LIAVGMRVHVGCVYVCACNPHAHGRSLTHTLSLSLSPPPDTHAHTHAGSGDDVKDLLHVWGTPYEQGKAQGQLLGDKLVKFIQEVYVPCRASIGSRFWFWVEV
jgi:hypothetical protein